MNSALRDDPRFWPHLFFARSGFLGEEWVDDDSLFRSSVDESTQFWEALLDEEDPIVWSLAASGDFSLEAEFSRDFDISYMLSQGETRVLLARQGASWLLPGLTWPEARFIAAADPAPSPGSGAVRFAGLLPVVVFADEAEAQSARPAIEAILRDAGVTPDAGKTTTLAAWWLTGMTDRKGKVVRRAGSGYEFSGMSPRAAQYPESARINAMLTAWMRG